LERHLSELLDQPVISIDAPMIAAHQRLPIERGATEHGHIPANPARAVRGVPATHGEEIDPLTPL
jgi:hypothetical protein